MKKNMNKKNTEMVALPDDVWGVVKEFMIDWKFIWHKKLQESLKSRFIMDGEKKEKGYYWRSRSEVGIRAAYPKKLVREYFDMKKQLYYCYFRIPWQHKLEMRVSKGYSLVENNWIDAWNNLSDYDGDLNEYQGSW